MKVIIILFVEESQRCVQDFDYWLTFVKGHSKISNEYIYIIEAKCDLGSIKTKQPATRFQIPAGSKYFRVSAKTGYGIA
jgi:hypothetical protein